MFRFVLLTAGVALVVVLGLMIDAQSRMPPSRPPEPTGVCTIFALGRVEGATPEIELRTQLAGRVVEVLVEEGQFAEQGQVLLRLDDRPYQHEVALAAAEVELAEAKLERLLNGAHYQERTEAAALYRAKTAELERAQLAWKRTRELLQGKAISQQEADNRRTEVEAATAEVAAAKARLERLASAARPDEVRIENAQIQAAKARLESARVNLEWTQLRAPAGGQILKIDVDVGELAGPDSAMPAVIFADTSRYYVRAFVEELEAPRVKVGMTATITADGLPGKEFQGHVTRLSPRMGRKQLWSNHPGERYDTKTREVWIELEEGASLVLGLRVDVTIDPESGTVTRVDSSSTAEGPPAIPIQSALFPNTTSARTQP